jgi:hypothetical protein
MNSARLKPGFEQIRRLFLSWIVFRWHCKELNDGVRSCVDSNGWKPSLPGVVESPEPWLRVNDGKDLSLHSKIIHSPNWQISKIFSEFRPRAINSLRNNRKPGCWLPLDGFSPGLKTPGYEQRPASPGFR